MGYIKLANIKIEKQGSRCTFTGRYDTYSLDRVHIIRRSYSSGLVDDPRNIILGSRFFHTVFDDGMCRKPNGDMYTVRHMLEDFPWRTRAILHRMRTLDLYYFRRYCRRHRIQLDALDNVLLTKKD